MKNFFKYLDPLQLIGFGLSVIVSLALITAGQDTVISLLIGLALGIVTQLFDLQVRFNVSLERLEILSTGGIEKAIRSLEGVEVRRFTSGQEFYEYNIKRMREAKKTIDDMTFGEDYPESTVAADEAYKRYIQTVETVCQKKTIAYRELMSLSYLPYMERAESRLRKGFTNYRIAYYLFDEKDKFPILQFMVIDSEEVIIGFYQAYTDNRAARPIQVALKHPDLAALFQDYYNVLWEKANPLKDILSLEDLKTRWAKRKDA